MRVDVVSGKARKLIIVLLSLTLIMGITTVAAALQDMIWTYSDSAHTVEATTFGDGDTVYLKITDSETFGGTKIDAITVENNTIENTILVDVTDDNSDSFYFGSFVIHSEANDDINDKLTMFDGQTATITVDLDGDTLEGTATITADYVTELQDNIWTYSDPTFIVEETEFADGDTVYVKVTDTVTKGGTKEITVQNDDKWNEIHVDVTDDNSDSFYYGFFVVYSGANDDANDKLALFYGETATITADLANDRTPGTKIIYAAYISPPPTNLTAAAIAAGSIRLDWTASSPETNVAQYNIYRATSSGGHNYSSPTYVVSVGISSYADSAATQGQTYYYVVRAQDAAGNTDSNTNEASATAGFAFTVDQVYTRYQDSLLSNLITSTDRYNPAAFTKGKIDEIYLKVNLLGPASLNESSSSIALYRLVNNEAEEVLGSQGVNQGTGWAELSFHLDSEFDPDLDQHSRDGLYWVDIKVVDTAANSGDYDFYFIYDTSSPSTPSFGITSFDPAVGYITVSGTTVPDELSDPQQVEIFLNGASQGTVTADANYRFVKSNIALASGTNSVEVQSTDRAGNKSELSESLKLDYNPVGLLSAVFRSVHVVKSGSSIDIIYSVTQPAQITIQVFNLPGEIVKEWQGSVSSDIENRWTWHGRNMYEQEVNNGVYICKINAQASDGTSEQKIKLLAVVR